ncbi:MAG TPA: hypothetical protein PLI42_02095 [Candidatus Pacearchaeota archaeon]|jgi:hypothetical protein|nr:hypothetical protein [Candidatus Pacearchaeota archaeon]HOS12768.1 hypothetical protein [Candidatus Pacearchaeota archaeon]
MKRIFIPEKVVFYIESNREMGTIHDLKSGKRAYVNSDMIEVIQHLLDGHVLDSFFPAKEIPQKERMELISQSKSVLRNLVSSGLLTEKKPNKQPIHPLEWFSLSRLSAICIAKLPCFRLQRF